MSPRSGGINRPVGWRHFIYGGVASCLAELGTFPLDMTKTRLQFQGQQSGHMMSSEVSPVRKKYKGMLDALTRIPREEGIRTLYRGISPALLRQSTYGTLKFGFYYSMKKLFPQENVASNMVCAVAAGMVSAAIANPTDVLKVRMQVACSTSGSGSSSLIESFYKIYKYEGMKGLWRGVGSTSQRAGVIAAVELPVYDGFKQYFIVSGLLEDGPPNHLISSFIASFTAAVASTPIDVIRTRLMSQKLQRHSTTENYGAPNGQSGVGASPVRFSQANSGESSPPSATQSSSSYSQNAKVYKSSWECLKVTLKHEGPRALWKGFIPAWLRMGPWNLIFFTSYEQLLRLY